MHSLATDSATSASSRVVDHQHGCGVADDVVQLGHGEAGVQRQEHRADPAAGELHLQRIGRVQRQHRDPVAALDLEPVAQMRGEPRNPAVELRVGELAFAGEIDHRRLVRRAAAEMGDPVIMANRQGFLLGYRGLAPRDGRRYALSSVGERIGILSCVEWLGWA